MSNLSAPLSQRSDGKCELCGSEEGLDVLLVPPGEETADRAIYACSSCRDQIEGRTDLDENHWHCLQGAVWSEVPAVQVVSLRMLGRLKGVLWASDLLESVYASDEIRAWAAEGADGGADDDEAPTLDSNGARLADGDSVTLIKDLDVKGGGFTAKRGTLVKNIRLTGDPVFVEGKVGSTMIVLRTEFLKKAS